MKYLIRIYILAMAVALLGCEMEFKPGNALLAEDAVKTPQDVQAVLVGAYSALRENFLDGRYQLFAEVMGDNINGQPGALNNADYLAFYNKSTSYFTGYTQNSYGTPFRAINRANTAFSYAASTAGVSQQDRKRIQAEARFIRALCHFEVVRLFAQPYGYTPENTHLGITVRTDFSDVLTSRNRNTVKEVYDQILTDLRIAASDLPETNGNYATKFAAQAYLAKVFFQMNRFDSAAFYAEAVVKSGKYSLDSDLKNRFSQNVSPETVFGLISTDNTNRASSVFGDLRSDLANNQLPTLKFTNAFLGLYADNDERKKWFVTRSGGGVEFILTNRFDGDFINVALTHLTEMLLIHAEALAASKNAITTEALASLNLIRNRAGIGDYASSGKTLNNFLDEVRLQRRLEMVGEGTRFHDLRRRCMLDRSLTIRGAKCDCDGMAVQFPDTELSGAGGPAFFTPNPEGNCY
jgi:hypothetical protein